MDTKAHVFIFKPVLSNIMVFLGLSNQKAGKLPDLHGNINLY
jgi:hypothetical protein